MTGRFLIAPKLNTYMETPSNPEMKPLHTKENSLNEIHKLRKQTEATNENICSHILRICKFVKKKIMSLFASSSASTDKKLVEKCDCSRCKKYLQIKLVS